MSIWPLILFFLLFLTLYIPLTIPVLSVLTWYAYRWNIFGCRWKSLLCCPWGSEETLWLWGGCVECRCYNFYLIERGSSILGWWGYIYPFAVLFTLPFCFWQFFFWTLVCLLQNLNKGYLNKFWMMILIFHLIPGPVFQRVQRIWSGRC